MHKFWIIIRLIIVVSIGLYIFIMLYFTIKQSRFIYFPEKNIFATPLDMGYEYKEIFFDTTDGIKLNGWYIPSENPRGVLLFCHGNAGNISHRMDSIKIFHEMGFIIFIFDYRGYGMSEGKPGEKGTYMDIEAAWEYLVDKLGIPSDKIIIFGRSMGGAVASYAAKKYKPKALIVESTYTSIKDMASYYYPFIPAGLIVRFNYNTKEYIRGVECPVLIIHSREDEIVPFTHGLQLYKEAGEPKEFLEIQGPHNGGYLMTGEHYIKGLDSFVSGFNE